MEPTSMIVGALIAGASSILKKTANKAVQDAYQGLKTLIVQYWQSKTEKNAPTNTKEVESIFTQLETNPETYKLYKEKELIQIIPNPDNKLIEQATQLKRLIELSKNQITIGNDAKGVQIGDHNKQNNNFT